MQSSSLYGSNSSDSGEESANARAAAVDPDAATKEAEDQHILRIQEEDELTDMEDKEAYPAPPPNKGQKSKTRRPCCCRPSSASQGPLCGPCQTRVS